MVWPKDFLMQESKATKIDYLECALWKLAMLLSNIISKKILKRTCQSLKIIFYLSVSHNILIFFFYQLLLLSNTKTLLLFLF